MYIVLFSLWLIFNAKVTVEIIAFGLFFSTAIFWFLCKYMGYSIKKDIQISSQIFYILQYIVALLFEIVKAVEFAEIFIAYEDSARLKKLKILLFEIVLLLFSLPGLPSE